jgi:hypothetical protein
MHSFLCNLCGGFFLPSLENWSRQKWIGEILEPEKFS